MLLPFTEEPSVNPEGDAASGSGAPPIMEESGSGSGDTLEPNIITCSSDLSQFVVSGFEQIASSLGVFECSLDSDGSNSTGLLFTIVLPSDEKITVTQEIGNMLLLDYFDAGSIELVVSVCTYTAPMETCDGGDTVELGSVDITVTSHEGRTLPYGENTGDSSFRNVLDGAISISIPQTIPFYSGYYHSLYVS